MLLRWELTKKGGGGKFSCVKIKHFLHISYVNNTFVCLAGEA
jgi:hypothetical protein